LPVYPQVFLTLTFLRFIFKLIDSLRNEFRNEITIFRAKTTKHEEVNTAYSLTSGELFAAEKS